MTPGNHNLIFLIGLRGSGKTTIGRLLAEHLGASFDDLDDIVRAHFGVDTIREIWDTHGERTFRDQEAASINDIISAHTPAGQESGRRIVSLGGGSPTAPGANRALAEAQDAAICDVIYLESPPAALGARITKGDPDRPSLTGADPVREIADVYAQRHTRYAQLARHSVDATGTIEQVLARTIDAIS
jgi:shikimate kinase